MPKSVIALLVLVLLLSPALHAGDYPPYNADLQPGAFCDIPINELHPTQFNVGKIEVARRAKKIAKMPDWKLTLYMNEHILPVVIGPGGVPYVTDHHHFACAMEIAGHTDIVAHIIKNFHDLSPGDFWARMKAAQWVYPYDKGAGPKDVSTLPAHMADMTDDPYRSLAWAVRDAGGYGEDTTAPYADFHWADFFRSRVKIAAGDDGFDEAVQAALKLAHSPDAKALPGYGMKPAKD